MPAAQTAYQPDVVVSTDGIEREQWLAYRRTGIGGSDASAVLGESPFTTARDLYYDKLGIASANDDEDNWVQKEIGTLLEDLVAKIFHIKTGYRIYQIKKMYRHPVHTFMIADVDYFVELPDGRKAILEIKTTNYNSRHSWWDEGVEAIPLYYELQGRHYMAVMNMGRVYLCCLYGNNEDEVIIRHIDRDMEYETELIALEEDFWVNHLLAKVPPPYTEDGDLVMESIRRHHGAADPDAQEIVLEGDCAANIARFADLQEVKKELDRRLKAANYKMSLIKGLVVDTMGKACLASCIVDGAPWQVTYKPVYTTGIDKDNLLRLKERHPDIYDEYVTVSESRRFYVKQKKKEAA